MKSIEEIKKVISKLNIVDFNSEDSYKTVENLMKNELLQFALPTKVFEPGMILFRCSNHYDSKDFVTTTRLSYRTDLAEIKEFGRANIKEQGVFYCTDEVATAIGETNSVFRGDGHKNVDSFSVTVSVWRSIAPLEFTLIINNKFAQEKNAVIKKYKTDIDKLIKELFNGEAEQVHEILNFISNEFALNTNGNLNLYKISSAFSQLAFETSDGVMYPSVQRKLEGNNFAIKPSSVDKKLEFVEAYKYKFVKKGESEYVQSEVKNTIEVKGINIKWGENTSC